MAEEIPNSIFKAYDIRGIYPTELNEAAAYRIAQAYAKVTGAKHIVLGRDVRASGASLWDAVAKGLVDHGVNVTNIGVITTDMMYFASAAYEYDGGITISASHNPGMYNGMKMMKKGAIAISSETGIKEIQALVQSGYAYKAEQAGSIDAREILDDYLKKCLSFVDSSAIRPLHVVVNGMFGPIVQVIERLALPITLTKLNDIPDGTFPKGPPDPLLEENRRETIALVQSSGADMGAAWDGDADRFFLFDEKGRWIPGYFITAFLGAYVAIREPGATIIGDPRLTWATIEAVRKAGGHPIINRVGHSFIKQRMRSENAAFAGEMSGHFYFRDFFYADNGLIPFLLILEIVSKSGKKLSELFEPYLSTYFISGEINTKLPSQDVVLPILNRIQTAYADATIEHIDGLSLEYDNWRANIRSSNTEPLLRLNVEARDQKLLEEKTKELQALIAA